MKQMARHRRASSISPKAPPVDSLDTDDQAQGDEDIWMKRKKNPLGSLPSGKLT